MSASSFFIIVVCFVYTTSADFEVKKINRIGKPFEIQISGDPLKKPVTFLRVSQNNPRFHIEIDEPNFQKREFQVITPQEETGKCIVEKTSQKIQKVTEGGQPNNPQYVTISMQDLKKELDDALETQQGDPMHQDIIHFLTVNHEERVTIKGYKTYKYVQRLQPNKYVQPKVHKPGEYVTRQNSRVHDAALEELGFFTPGQYPNSIIVARMVKDSPFTIEIFGGPITIPLFFSAVPQSNTQFYIGEKKNKQDFKVIQPENPVPNSPCIQKMHMGTSRVMTTEELQKLLRRAVSIQPDDTVWMWNPIHFNSRVAVTIISGRQVVRYNQRHPMQPIANAPNDPVGRLPRFYIPPADITGTTTKGIQTKEGEVEDAPGTGVEEQAAGEPQEGIPPTGAHEDYYNVDEVRYSDGVVPSAHQAYYDMDRLHYSDTNGEDYLYGHHRGFDDFDLLLLCVMMMMMVVIVCCGGIICLMGYAIAFDRIKIQKANKRTEVFVNDIENIH